MSRFPKTKPPFDVNVFESWLLDRAEKDDRLKNRLRRGISFMVVAAVLSELQHRDGTPLFILKGGVSMQLRFGLRARTSEDLDATFRAELHELEAVVAEAPNHPVGPFGVRAVGKPLKLGPTGAFRQILKISYGADPWGEIPLEVSPPEGQSVDLKKIDYLDADPDPSVFGLDALDAIPCLPVSYQIAQKLHACTEVKLVEPPAEANVRFHDLLDLQLLKELTDEGSFPAIRQACVEIFGLRVKQAWPPRVTIYPSWPDGYRALANENEFPVDDVQVAVELVHALIDQIDAAAVDPHYAEADAIAEHSATPSVEAQPA